MRIVMFGCPGAGKGTQAKVIAAKSGAKHISTGDMLREAIANGTEIGKKANEFMSKGELVPDEVVVGIVKEKLVNDKIEDFILDGFPRTLPQAEALDVMLEELGLPVENVVNLNIDHEIIVNRLCERRVCLACGETYHLKNNPPKTEGKCNACGADLVHRSDDQPEAIKNRLDQYDKKTAPLIDFYKKQGKIIDIDACGSIDDIRDNIFRALGL